MIYRSFILTVICISTLLTACTGGSTSDSGSAVKDQIMLVSGNWGDESLIITDDILGYDDGDTASTRAIIGDQTTISNPDIDSVAVDKNRAVIYLSDAGTDEISVFENMGSAEGNIAPDRTISISGETFRAGLAVDSERDILYAADATSKIWIIKNASTLDGDVTPDAVLSYDVMSLFIDETNNRLYAGADYSAGNKIYVFDGASALATGAAADRTMTFSDNFDPTGIWVDSQSNRLYTCDNVDSGDGNNLFAYENASTMDGAYNVDTDSVARIEAQCISLMVDCFDNLYAWPGSATYVRIYSNASSLSGDITGPDRTIYGVVNNGYGMDYLAY